MTHSRHAHPSSIFKLTAAYKADTYEKKVNLGVGAYRDDNGKPWVLPVVQKVRIYAALTSSWRLTGYCPFSPLDATNNGQANEILLKDTSLDHEYLPITGMPEFTSAAAKLMFGSSSAALTGGRVAR